MRRTEECELSITEKRSSRRSSEQATGLVSIEIEHSYGPRATSIYQVLEADERGLSFLVPGEDGYFLDGIPLRFTLIQKDRLRTKHSGFTRSSLPTNSELGERMYRIGVQISDALRTPRERSMSSGPRA